MSSSRDAIVRRLRANQEVDDWADLAIYPSGSLFVVEFLPPTGPFDPSGLGEELVEMLAEEGELSEYFETPEEAADLYLELESRCEGRLMPKKAVFSDESAGPRKPRAGRKEAGPPAVTAETFEEEVSGGPVAVLFWSPLSGPDRLALAAVTAAAGGVRVVTLDVDESPEVAAGLKVEATPAVLVFRGGSLVGRAEGALTEESLRAALRGAR